MIHYITKHLLYNSTLIQEHFQSFLCFFLQNGRNHILQYIVYQYQCVNNV